MSDIKKFWAVWKENGGAPPSKRHETIDAAKQEAARLARQENARYYVLEAVGIVAPVQAPVAYTEIGNDNYQFHIGPIFQQGRQLKRGNYSTYEWPELRVVTKQQITENEK